ncbi:unnamed protein product [Nezara viridula]|uniref:Uncharacterized protein n=1 Tax=Nezara viridula TaxID=85310 RepID=A0A9P0MLA5_NEZVI|nr:unnamed protein product [Nezara viridula]
MRPAPANPPGSLPVTTLAATRGSDVLQGGPAGNGDVLSPEHNHTDNNNDAKKSRGRPPHDVLKMKRNVWSRFDGPIRAFLT